MRSSDVGTDGGETQSFEAYFEQFFLIIRNVETRQNGYFFSLMDYRPLALPCQTPSLVTTDIRGGGV